MKKILKSILLLFAVGAIAYYVWGRIAGNTGPVEADTVRPQSVAASEASAEVAAAPSVVVTYFTTDVRCASCVKIEELTRAAVEEQFADEVAADRVRFRILNLDRPENKHFARDYEMAFKTVVISQESSDDVLRWEKRDEVWKLLDKPEQFKAYVAAPVHEFLNSSS